jgi:hypothetical protein
LQFVRWYRSERRLDVLFDDSGTERLIKFTWQGTDSVPGNWLEATREEAVYQRNQEALRAIRGLTPGDLGG